MQKFVALLLMVLEVALVIRNGEARERVVHACLNCDKEIKLDNFVEVPSCKNHSAGRSGTLDIVHLDQKRGNLSKETRLAKKRVELEDEEDRKKFDREMRVLEKLYGSNGEKEPAHVIPLYWIILETHEKAAGDLRREEAGQNMVNGPPSGDENAEGGSGSSSLASEATPKQEGEQQQHQTVHIIMAFASGGDLQDVMSHAAVRLDEFRVRYYVAEALLGLKAMYEANICDIDRKQDNMLLTDKGHLVHTDFDRSYAFANSEEVIRDKLHLKTTIQIQPPETLDNVEQSFNLKQCMAMQMWAVGCLMSSTLLGFHPFLAEKRDAETQKMVPDDEKTRERIKREQSSNQSWLHTFYQNKPLASARKAGIPEHVNFTPCTFRKDGQKFEVTVTDDTYNDTGKLKTYLTAERKKSLKIDPKWLDEAETIKQKIPAMVRRIWPNESEALKVPIRVVVSANFLALLKRLLAADPNDRPTLEEVMNHDWMKMDARVKGMDTHSIYAPINFDDNGVKLLGKVTPPLVPKSSNKSCKPDAYTVAEWIEKGEVPRLNCKASQPPPPPQQGNQDGEIKTRRKSMELLGNFVRRNSWDKNQQNKGGENGEVVHSENGGKKSD